MFEYDLIDFSDSFFTNGIAFLQRLKQMANRFFFLCSIATCFIFSQNCAQEEVVSPADSQSQLHAAANYLSNKCGTPIPVPFPIIVEEVQQKNLDLCTIAITKSECPFVSYPFACILIYVDKPLNDIPWYLNFQEIFVKTKL